MTIKKYERKYERVFTGDDLLQKKCDLTKIEIADMSELEYRQLWKSIHTDMQQVFYQSLVRYIWLSRKFNYNGNPHPRTKQNGYIVDRAFGVYTRNFIGHNNRLFFSLCANAILGYVDEFIPFLEKADPFKETFPFPYQFMNLEALVLVYQMPERLELLAYGEEQKMNYTEFMDYVLNYISCYNEEHGEIYHFTFSRNVPCYVKKKI